MLLSQTKYSSNYKQTATPKGMAVVVEAVLGLFVSGYMKP